MQGNQLRRTLGDRLPVVMLGIPFVGTDVGQKPFRFLDIAEIRIIKVMRIPVQENSAEVEDDVFKHAHPPRDCSCFYACATPPGNSL